MKKTFLLTLIAILLLSCSSEELGEFKLAKSKWQTATIKNYQIDQRMSCYCGGILAWKLTVVDGVKDSVTYDEPTYSSGETYEDVLAKAKTVDEVFDFIESIDKNSIAHFDVSYDEDLGFPVRISIDYHKDHVDDEISYYYSDFVNTEISNQSYNK